MCMEDIRISRNTIARTRSEGLLNNGTLVLPANGKRVGVHFSGVFTTANTTMLIYRDSVDNANFIGAITHTNPNKLFRIEDYGTLVQGQLVLANTTGVTAVCGFIEMVLVGDDERSKEWPSKR